MIRAATKTAIMAMSKANSAVEAVASLDRTKRTRLITATRPTASSGWVTRWGRAATTPRCA